MKFETTERIFAIHPSKLDAFLLDAISKFGENLPDGRQVLRTIAGHWDNSTKTRIRAASLQSGSISGTLLSDGRIAFICLWQSDLIRDFEDGNIPDIDELTIDQFTQLSYNDSP